MDTADCQRKIIPAEKFQYSPSGYHIIKIPSEEQQQPTEDISSLSKDELIKLVQSFETKVKEFQESQRCLEKEKQHFNSRLRDKDIAMKDLADKFANLAAENTTIHIENQKLKSELEQLNEVSQNSVKELLSKKFKEVEDLYDELYKAQQEIKQLDILNKQVERMLLNQTEIIDKLQLHLQARTGTSITRRVESQINVLKADNTRLCQALQEAETLLHIKHQKTQAHFHQNSQHSPEVNVQHVTPQSQNLTLFAHRGHSSTLLTSCSKFENQNAIQNQLQPQFSDTHTCGGEENNNLHQNLPPESYTDAHSLDTIHSTLPFGEQEQGISHQECGLSESQSVHNEANSQATDVSVGSEALLNVRRPKNMLEIDLSSEIREFNEEFRYERQRQETNEFAPLDPNLVCPYCAKAHHEGEIQKYKKHVENCDHKKLGQKTISVPTDVYIPYL